MIVSPPWLKRTKVAANLRVVVQEQSRDEDGILQLLFDTPLKAEKWLYFLLYYWKLFVMPSLQLFKDLSSKLDLPDLNNQNVGVSCLYPTLCDKTIPRTSRSIFGMCLNQWELKITFP